MSAAAGIVLLFGRILFSVFFAKSGIGHVRRHQTMGDYSRAASFPAPYLAGWPAGVWLLAASLSIALGIWPDLGSLMVAVFVVPAGLYFHRFWTLEDRAQRQTQSGNLFRNLARRVQQSASRRPAILVNQTAEHVRSFDLRSGSTPDLRCSVTGGYGQAQSPMWPVLYVVSDVSLEHSFEVPTTVDQDVVEALLAHGPHEPLREGVGSRCPDRRSDDADALGRGEVSGRLLREGGKEWRTLSTC